MAYHSRGRLYVRIEVWHWRVSAPCIHWLRVMVELRLPARTTGRLMLGGGGGGGVVGDHHAPVRRVSVSELRRLRSHRLSDRARLGHASEHSRHPVMRESLPAHNIPRATSPGQQSQMWRGALISRRGRTLYIPEANGTISAYDPLLWAFMLAVKLSYFNLIPADVKRA